MCNVIEYSWLKAFMLLALRDTKISINNPKIHSNFRTSEQKYAKLLKRKSISLYRNGRIIVLLEKRRGGHMTPCWKQVRIFSRCKDVPVLFPVRPIATGKNEKG